MTEESTFDRINREAAQAAHPPRQRPLDGTEGDYARPNGERDRVVCGFRRSKALAECQATVAFLHSPPGADHLGWVLLLSDAFLQGDDAIWRWSTYAMDRSRQGGARTSATAREAGPESAPG